MTYIFDEYGERHRFDAFCKTVLRYEAINYFRELNRQRKYSIQFSALSQSELGKLYTVDEYPSDSFIFSAFGYVLYLHEEMMADAFSRLPESEQTILILHCVLELPDKEVGNFVGMSRSTVQRHRTKTLNKLRKNLEAERVRN
jgi:RNA polymerase sigma factor (sigma-70 family)